MPGRKRPASSGPAHRRTRTGCQACRARKIKCDETKPRCRNCLSRDLVCENGLALKWHEEFETRGLTFGREGVWTKAPGREPARASTHIAPTLAAYALPPILGRHFLNTTFSDFERCGADVPIEEDIPQSSGSNATLHASFVRTGHVTRSLSLFPGLGHFRSSALEYYMMRICPLTTSSRLIPSPFADLVLPLFAAAGHEDVLLAVLALSARHRSITDPAWSQAAMTYKGGVLASLQKRLAVADGVLDPQVLAIMMFLCLYEIVDRCDHRWVIHLRASQDIIRQRKTSGYQLSTDNDLAAFAERFFAFQDAISRTACGEAPLFDTEYWNSLDQHAQVDAWMGCSPELAGILCEITNIGRARMTGALSPSELGARANALTARIGRMELSDQLVEDQSLRLAAQLKRASALLYLQCMLYDGSPSAPEVSRLVRSILEKIYFCVLEGCVAGLAFPVFVAAVAMDPSDEPLIDPLDSGDGIHGRRLVLETLDAMSRDSLSNVSRTRAVIQRVWKLRDMDCDTEGVAGTGNTSSAHNDWSQFVGPHSSYISLV